MIKEYSNFQTLVQEEQAIIEEAVTQNYIHTIQKGKGQVQTPFFFFHGDWTNQGLPLYCLVIARTLGKSQPFYALEPWNCSKAEPLPSIEQQAKLYIKYIREAQPEGPYRLGGYCNGALICYEVARLLKAEGAQVQHLLLIEPPTLAPYVHLFYRTINAIGGLLFLAEEQKRACFLQTRHFIRRIFLHVYPSTFSRERFKGHLLRIDPHFNKLLPSMTTLQKEPMAVWSWILKHYTWGTYNGDIITIWARHEVAAQKRWTQECLGQRIEHHVVSGNHTSIFQEDIAELTVKVKECLT